jgi:hypothetical protein
VEVEKGWEGEGRRMKKEGMILGGCDEGGAAALTVTRGISKREKAWAVPADEFEYSSLMFEDEVVCCASGRALKENWH